MPGRSEQPNRFERACAAALAGLLHHIPPLAARAGVDGAQPADFVPVAWQTELRGKGAGDDSARLERAIRLAEILAVGGRPDDGDPLQLLSIFCRVQAEGVSAPPAYLPLRELAMQREVLFPADAVPVDTAKAAYADLWRNFAGQVMALRRTHAADGDRAVYLESLLLLCRRYFWSVPSGTFQGHADISLYDHSRMTAALAAILVERDLGDWHRDPASSGEHVALLVGGDLSGVQDFIYTITARGAASALRGRSFYLQLLTEAAARYILRALDLPISNLIYAGGGTFYLLARPGDEDRLAQAQAHLDRALLRHHRGDLYLAMAAQPLAARDFFGGEIGHRWRDLTEQFQRSKLRRFRSLGDQIGLLFAVPERGGNIAEHCVVCGAEHPGVEPDREAVTADPPADAPKCPQCVSYERLGEQLRRAHFLRLEEFEPSDVSLPGAPGNSEEALAALGLRADLFESVPTMDPPPGRRSVLLALRDDDQGALQPAPRRAIGRRFLVNVTPTLTEAERQQLLAERFDDDLPAANRVKPFGALAWQSQGIRRLGVLRMDVDNLGKLFSEGMEGIATLARVATLSFAVSLFFEGWVGALAEQRSRANDAGNERLYSIYSGGDDLFFVGSWDAVVELAREIRADLTPYVAHHPGIHASAGISLAAGKYPLYQAARDAGRAEDQAKDLVWHDGRQRRTKDAVCFLGRALPWPRFGLDDCPTRDAPSSLENAHALAHLLVGLAGGGGEGTAGLGSALIRRLNDLYDQFVEAEKRLSGVNWSGEAQTPWGPWIPRTFYTLSRMAKQMPPGIVRDEVNALRERLRQDDYRMMEWIGIAARWAELLRRD